MMSVGEVRALYYGAAVVEEGVWPFPITSSLLVGLSFFFSFYTALLSSVDPVFSTACFPLASL